MFFLILFQVLLLSFQVPLGEKESYTHKAVAFVSVTVKHSVSWAYHALGQFWDSYFSFRDSRRDNAKLQKAVLSLRQENLFLKNSLKKFEEERIIRKNLSDFHENIIIANVIGIDLNNYYKTVILDRGTLDGIHKDMVVLDKHGFLAGRVARVLSFKESRIQLITDNDIGLGAFTEKGGSFGILTGDGKGLCLLKYILKTDVSVLKGQSVFTSGQDAVFPRNIPVGKITGIRKSDALFKVVKVQPFFRFNDLDRLIILRGNMKTVY